MVSGMFDSLSGAPSDLPVAQSLGLLSFVIHLSGDAALMMRYDLDLLMEHNYYLNF